MSTLCVTVYDVFSSLKIERFLTSSNFSWFYELVFCFLWAFSGVLVNTFYRQIIYGIDIYHQSSGKPSRLTKNQDLWKNYFSPVKVLKLARQMSHVKFTWKYLTGPSHWARKIAHIIAHRYKIWRTSWIEWAERKIATSGNRTRASRVAGENSTTEPTLLVSQSVQFYL